MDRLKYEVAEPVYKVLGMDWHPEQMAIIKGDDRFPVIGGGEGAGKSIVTAGILAPHAIAMPMATAHRVPHKFWVTTPGRQLPRDRDGQPVLQLLSEQKGFRPHQKPDIVIFGPHYKEPKDEFGILRDWLDGIGKLNKKFLSEPRDGAQYMVTTDGVVIQTWSLEIAGDVRSIEPEIAAVCETGNCDYGAVERIQGRISRTQGPIIYNGTMELAQQWYRDWMLIGKIPGNRYGIKSYSLPAYTNRHLFPGGLDHPEMKRLKELYPDDIFAMRVLAEPRPAPDRVIPEFTTEHVHEMDIPAGADIELWIDPGYRSAYALLWVAIWDVPKRNNETSGAMTKHFHVFDELYEQGKTNPDIISMARTSPYWKRVRKIVMDVAGKGHRDANESAEDTWLRMTQFNIESRLWGEQTLIERIRVSAKADQVSISPRCRGLLAELGLEQPFFPGMHHWKNLVDSQGNVTTDNPIDKWNHSAKALGYGLLNHLDIVEPMRKPRNYNRLKAAYEPGDGPGRSVGSKATMREPLPASAEPGRSVASSRTYFRTLTRPRPKLR